MSITSPPYKLQEGIDSSAGPYESSSPLHPSTSWIPLEGLAEQWAAFGRESVTAPDFQATSHVFCALAAETNAYHLYLEAQQSALGFYDLTSFEQALDELLQARQEWSEAMHALQLRLCEVALGETQRAAIRAQIIQVMQQRLRLSVLLVEVEEEALSLWRAGQITQPGEATP
jgi:hypothetical protein